MGLDVGVVTVNYLTRPGEPVFGFLFDLMLDPYTGMGDDSEYDDTWGGGWDNNGLYEFSRIGLRKRANNWANERDCGPSEKAKLRRWIRNLPWEGDHIMLHLGN